MTSDISVVVPTYRRPRDLERCLRALEAQLVAPAEVVVVARPDDLASRRVAESFEGRVPVRVGYAVRPGQVQALNRGLAMVRTPLVAITDDDACPRDDWLDRILGHFADPTVGAVGGRDVVHHSQGIDHGHAQVVGRVTWFGRVVGNHHLDAPLQDVQFLKGANMSYRCRLLPGLDENLVGDGAQACNDMQASLRVSATGSRVVWDPRVIVDHFPAERFDEDARHAPSMKAVANALHNQTYILLSLIAGWRRVTAFCYALAVGTRSAPGVVLFPLDVVRTRSAGQSWRGFRANTQGRLRGLRTYWVTRGRPSFGRDDLVTGCGGG